MASQNTVQERRLELHERIAKLSSELITTINDYNFGIPMDGAGVRYLDIMSPHLFTALGIATFEAKRLGSDLDGQAAEVVHAPE